MARLTWRCAARWVAWAAVLAVATAIVSTLGLVGTAAVLSDLLSAARTPAGLLAAAPAVLPVLLLYGARGLLEAGLSAAGAVLGPTVRFAAEEKLYRASSRIELASFDDPEHYEALARAKGRGVTSVEGFLDQTIVVLTAATALIASAAAVGVLNPLLLPTLVLAALPAGWSTVRNARSGYRSMLRIMAENRRLATVSELLTARSAAAELRAFTARRFLLGLYRQHARRVRREQVRIGMEQVRVTLLGRALSGVGGGAAYAGLLWLVYSGRTELASAGAAVVAIHLGRAALTRLVSGLSQLYDLGLYAGDYLDFLDRAGTVTRPQLSAAVPSRPRRLELARVTFRYPGQLGRVALDDVSLTIRRGTVVAVVGENGSGKSTLAKLLVGLYQPSSGTVRWDDVDLATVDPELVWHNVAFVFQHPVRWPMTARQNVTIGRPGQDDPEDIALAATAALARADGVVAQLPDGWDTLLSKEFTHGHDLSGGQWQRLAIARALYRQAPVLVLDEPTAGLDPAAESAIHQSLRCVADDQTILLVSHRLESARFADQVVVMHDGRIVEQGTHAGLLAENGRYARLFATQRSVREAAD